MRLCLGIQVTRRKLLLVLIPLLLMSFLYLCAPSSKLARYVPDSRPGAVFSLYMYEQMGNAASNLMNLQCWASSVNVEVVEPSIRKSNGGGDGVFYFTKDYLNVKRFRDLFDFERWNEYRKVRGYAPLISVEEFLEKASRNVIYVKVLYSGVLDCPLNNIHLVRNLLNAPLRFFRHKLFGTIISFPSAFLSSHGFTVVRKVCINLLQNGRLRTQKEFNQLIFGDLLGTGNFTVIFDEWRAIRNETEREGKLSTVKSDFDYYRILVKDSPCTFECLEHKEYYKMWNRLPKSDSPRDFSPVNLDTAALKKSKLGFIPSDYILDAAAAYRTKYLNNKPYVAIMMRMENMHEKITDKNSYNQCLKKLKSLWEYAMETYKLNQTFLSSDMGKYGSQSWQTASQQLSVQFQQDIMKITHLAPSYIDTLDRDFEDTLSSNGRVEVAWTQGIVVAEARCVIFLGGGSFHGLVQNINSALYMGKGCFVYLDKWCIEYAKLGFD